jgi:NAD(P)-dependent dehydrogenase (short-subunit alcohol dehydrogenase family)
MGDLDSAGISGNFDLSGKVAVVTGAGTGIGAGVARRLAACGADLCLQYRSHGREAAAVATEVEALGRRVVSVAADFAADPGQAARVVDEAVARFGRVDILVSNAATWEVADEPFEVETQTRFEEILAVNVTAVFVGMQAAAGDMIRRGSGGRIINVSSVHSRQAAGMTAYEASKGAINALTASAAVSLGRHGITVNAVAPGAIWVERYEQIPGFDRAWYEGRIPLGRLGEADDIAAVVAFLASDAGRYVSGETIFVDGGLTRRLSLLR